MKWETRSNVMKMKREREVLMKWREALKWRNIENWRKCNLMILMKMKKILRKWKWMKMTKYSNEIMNGNNERNENVM
jgi:hypothetical protein